MLRQRRVANSVLEPLLGSDAGGAENATAAVESAGRLWAAIGPLCTLVGAAGSCVEASAR